MATGRNSYVSGMPKWTTNSKKPNDQSAPDQNQDLLRTMYGLICPDVIIDVANSSFHVYKGEKQIDIEFDSIVSIEFDQNRMTIFNLDETPYSFYFKTELDSRAVENRLFIFLNTGTEATCSATLPNTGPI